MEIKPTHPGQTQELTQRPLQPNATEDTARKTTGTDTVTVTSTAGQLMEAESKLADSPSLDRERIEAVRQAIADGQFEVNSREIAEKLIQQETDLV